MEQHQVEIHKGKVKITVTGLAGPACKTATERVQKALGVTISDVETGEFYENAESNVQTQNR